MEDEEKLREPVQWQYTENIDQTHNMDVPGRLRDRCRGMYRIATSMATLQKNGGDVYNDGSLGI
ncbi:MAG: hypothetical protein MUO26_03515 [Methanotrichaceae archaeon]|nr:hypothetical protein [Methanotrichaceae archaeon]